MKSQSILFTLILASSTAHAVSFDCARTATFVEQEICSNPLLGRLDDALDANYKNMLNANIGGGSRKDLRATQRKWLSDRNKCNNTDCLINAYRKRVDDICDYPVISGVHPGCTYSDEIK